MTGEYVVVSAIGRDRVGLADDIAAWIDSAGANVEESKMAVLGGDFAVIMLVSAARENIEKISGEAAGLAEDLNLQINVKKTTAPQQSSGGRPYMVETVSLDSPGIVHALTREIRSLGISIEDLDTTSSEAPWTGAPVFRMHARVILPAKLPVADFREHMENLAHEKDLDIRLEPI
jgi:glycine cleavage system transcriptional repressor